MDLKNTIKKYLKKLPLRFTKNQQYDYYTKKILQKKLQQNSSVIDIGCHKGEILDLILQYAPAGVHYAFEPIPNLFDNLQKKYAHQKQVHLYNYALSFETGLSTFNLVLSNMAYSGLVKRQYDKEENDTEIHVQKEKLDNVLANADKIDLIKIDVEGGELHVLQGAAQILAKHKPLIIFEHGKGASEYYDANANTLLFNLFEKLHYKISTLSHYYHQKNIIYTAKDFSNTFMSGNEYYFVAFA